MRASLAALVLVAAALPASAVEVRPCDYAASVQSIAEPWERNTRSFYNNAVRVALLDTGGEPVCCSQHLLILLPDRAGHVPGMDEGRLCRVVGDREQMGFLSIDVSRMRTRYDAGRGLLIEFPYRQYGHDGLRHPQGVARVRVDTDRGLVTPE
jgi:hypothetical protein